MSLPTHSKFEKFFLTFALLSLALMASVPFLITRHFQPLPSFSSEWWAAIFGLVAFAALFAQKWDALNFPQVALIPLFLIPVIGIQWLLGLVSIPSAAVIAIEYLLWASCIACLGSQINKLSGLHQLVKYMAWGLLLGGIASACASLVQYRQIPISQLLVFPSMGGRVYGNLGQPNHLSAQLWLAISAAIYLHLIRKLDAKFFVAALALMVFAAATSLSRSVFIYAPAVALLAAIRPDGRKIAILLPILQVAAILALPYFTPALNANQAVAPTQIATVARLGDTQNDIRLELWRDAWNMFVDHPWLGVGVGNYARMSVEYSAAKSGGIPMPAEHAHNLFLQLFAQYGLPATLVVVGLIAVFLRNNMRSLLLEKKAEGIFIASALSVIGLHSQLEYPLWYTYFLGPAFLLVGAIDTRTLQIRITQKATILCLVLLAGAAFLVPLKQDELRIERALLWPFKGQSPAEALADAILQIESISNNSSLLAPYGEIVLTTSISPSLSMASSHWRLCQSSLNFAPTASLLSKCAESARLLKLDEEAKALERIRVKAWAGKLR